MRSQNLALALSLVLAWPLSYAAPRISVRRFIKNCLMVLSEPAQIAKSIDFRNDFASELDRILQSQSSVKILDLGSHDYHPWTIQISDALEQDKKITDSDPSIHPYVLQRGEIIPLPTPTPDPKLENKSFNLIYDAGLGPASKLTGLSKSLHYAIDNLAPGGVFAVAFPYAKNPLTSTPQEVSSKIVESISSDKGLLHVERRYNFLKAYPSPDRGPDFIRLDGIYIRKKNGRFEPLITWIEKSMPEFEMIAAPLDLGSGALSFIDPFIHTTNMLHFNQLILRKKPTTTKPTQEAASAANERPRLRYVGTIGSDNPQSIATLPFHFFDEF